MHVLCMQGKRLKFSNSTLAKHAPEKVIFMQARHEAIRIVMSPAKILYLSSLLVFYVFTSCYYYMYEVLPENIYTYIYPILPHVSL